MDAQSTKAKASRCRPLTRSQVHMYRCGTHMDMFSTHYITHRLLNNLANHNLDEVAPKLLLLEPGDSASCAVSLVRHRARTLVSRSFCAVPGSVAALCRLRGGPLE